MKLAIFGENFGSEPFRSRANSLPRANRPIGPWPIRSLALSLLGHFVPWPFHSLSVSFSGTFVPWLFRCGHRRRRAEVEHHRIEGAEGGGLWGGV